MTVPNLVYIPTIGRVGNQPTYDTLPKEVADIAVLVCPSAEVDEHIKRGRRAVACDARGISAVRQWICENADTKMVIMCDDDHKWFVRACPTAYNLRPATPSEVGRMFGDLRSLLDMYPLAGISRRQHNNAHFPETVKTVTRQCNIHGVDCRFLEKHDIRWDALPLMEDFHVTLSVLRKGTPNAMIVDRAWDQLASNAPGGCSTYRNWELQNKAATRLQELHPEFVNLVTKESKTGWDGMTSRTDVRVAWKKAYESGRI